MKKIPLILVYSLIFLGSPMGARAGGEKSTQNYSDLYQEMLKYCDNSAQQLGIQPGCPGAIKACLNDFFSCVKENHGCELETVGGIAELQCSQSPIDCKKADLTALLLSYKSKNPKCPNPTDSLNVSQMGCGNNVVEPGEKCDEGSPLESATCAKNCGMEPPDLCGNLVTDPGEECDAGKDNGNLISGCDLDCKKITAAGNPVNPVTGKNDTTPVDAGAMHCALSLGDEGPTTSWPYLFVGPVSFLLLRWRERRLPTARLKA